MNTKEILQGIKDWAAPKVIYDISAAHDNTKYADLSDALGTDGGNIPQEYRKGGITVRYVQSSDNKYVQWRLSSDTFNTTPANWQGVDDEPVAGSDNLVKSGGVYSGNCLILSEEVFATSKYITSVDLVDIKNMTGGYYNVTGEFNQSSDFVYQKVTIYPTKAYRIKTINSGHAISSLVFLDENDNLIYKDGRCVERDIIIIFPNNRIVSFAVSARLASYVELYSGSPITKILDSQIGTDKLQDNCVTADKIENNSIGGNKIQQESISPLLCTFFASVNLFNYHDPTVKIGFYLYNNVLYEGSDYFVSGFIKVKPNRQIIIRRDVTGVVTSECARWICYYDTNLNYLSTYTIDFTHGEKIFTTPADAAYLKFTGFNTNYDTYVVSYDTSIESYIPYQEQIKEEYIPSKQSILPDIILPKKIYALNNEQNSVYFKDIMSFVNPYLFAIENNGGGWVYYNRCMRTNGTSQNFNIKMTDVPTLLTLKTKSALTCLGDKATDNGNKVVNVIGDSFTYNGKWFDQIHSLCPNLSFVGMRKSYNTDPTLRAEGRGGWTLNNYATRSFDARAGKYYEGFSPFLHPDGYVYYGVTGFWADIVNNNIGSHTYEMNGFDDYISMFGIDGRKLNPENGDMMYDNTLSSYIYYNGTNWVEYSGTPTFAFDYAKYIQAWNITSPDFVLIMLGVNDFFSAYNDSIGNTFVSQLDSLIESIIAYAQGVNKTIRIGICTNNTITALPLNNYGMNTMVSSRSLFNGRKKVIETFDTTTYNDKGVFIVDTASAFDPDFGFGISKQKPFDYYAGEERVSGTPNGVHPNDAGYKQLGTCAAGFIQYMRGL